MELHTEPGIFESPWNPQLLSFLSPILTYGVLPENITRTSAYHRMKYRKALRHKVAVCWSNPPYWSVNWKTPKFHPTYERNPSSVSDKTYAIYRSFQNQNPTCARFVRTLRQNDPYCLPHIDPVLDQSHLRRRFLP